METKRISDVTLKSSVFSAFNTPRLPQKQNTQSTPFQYQPPQTSSVVNKDQYLPEKFEDSKNNIFDTVLKYSGLLALAAIPISIIVIKKDSGKLNNAINKISTQLTSLTKEVDDIKIAKDTIKTITTKTSNKLNYLLGLIAAGGAGVAAGSQIDKIKNALTPEEKNDIEKVVKEITKEKTPVINRTIYESTKPLEIWSGRTLSLNNTGKVKTSTINEIKSDIVNIISGKTQMTPVKNPTVWSTCYEGWGTAVGGQADIANEVPVELNKKGFSAIAIAPLFISSEDSAVKFALEPIDGQPNKFKYYSQKYKGDNAPVLEKIYDGKMGDGNYFQAYVADVKLPFAKPNEPQTQKVIFLHDDGEFLNFGKFDAKDNTYTAKPHQERSRIARFNKMVYELIAKSKAGEIKLPDGVQLEPPSKIIAHESWQTFGLLASMRILSRAEEADKLITKEQGDYLRKLANNTLTIIHNIGQSYQGKVWNEQEQSEFFNTLYGPYAHALVSNIFLDEVDNEKFFGTPLQRLAFEADACNPAAGALALGTVIGPVSAGYAQEIINEKMSGGIDPLMRIRNKNGGIIPMPNGVNREGLLATKANIDKLNNAIKDEIDKGVVEAIKPLAETPDDVDKLDSKNPDVIKSFAEIKRHNKKIFITLLKNMINEAKTAEKEGKKITSPLIGGSLGLLGGSKYINIDDINEDTPIFSMASRLDGQKGFDTIADAFVNICKNYKHFGLKEKPVLITSGGGHEELEKYLTNIKNKLGSDGNRIIFTKSRMSDVGLMLMSMASTIAMPSDFEPYGISDIKGMYAGSHIVGNAVGGMKATPGVSRKMYDLNIPDDKDNANSIMVQNYQPMSGKNEDEKNILRGENAQKLLDLILQDIKLSPEEKIRMDINAFKTDVSWNKGAIDNYINVMKLEK